MWSRLANTNLGFGGCDVVEDCSGVVMFWQSEAVVTRVTGVTGRFQHFSLSPLTQHPPPTLPVTDVTGVTGVTGVTTWLER
jgi:hypothetical protein